MKHFMGIVHSGRGVNHLEKIDHPLYTVKDGILGIKKGAVIPNGFII